MGYKYLTNQKGKCVDLKNLDSAQLYELSDEIRSAILNRVSKIGGHCGPNLGVVETTIALHKVFDLRKDRLVFDVSHQCYAHKILTGRSFAFIDDNYFYDITGYTAPQESEFDVFITGHTSTSISTSIGLAIARDNNKSDEKIIALIGDGSLSGGLALEALNVLGEYDSQLLVIVNDNQMSISENHGGLYKSLEDLRKTGGKSENNIFKAFNIDYEFLPNGHDIDSLVSAFSTLKERKKPVVLHIVTQKGHGFEPAVKDKEKFHYCFPFDISAAANGVELPPSINEKTYNFIKNLNNDKIQILNSATASTLALSPDRRKALGRNYIDVGIAEGAMVSIASGIAHSGCVPIVSVYSTFLQRAYDQIYHDVCINNLPVLFLVFSGTIFGMRDITHNGHFTDNLVSSLPNLTLLCPACEEDYFDTLSHLFSSPLNGPVAIKVPENPEKPSQNAIKKILSDRNCYSNVEVLSGKDVCVIAVGDMLKIGEDVCVALAESKISATLISASKTSIDFEKQYFQSLSKRFKTIAVIDNSSYFSGFSCKLSQLFSCTQTTFLSFAYKDVFTDGYNTNEFIKKNGLDVLTISNSITNSIKIRKFRNFIEKIF